MSSLTIRCNNAEINLLDTQIINNENFSDMKLSELVFIIELIMDCYNDKEQIPDKTVKKAMDLINDLDNNQHNLSKAMYELTKRLRDNVKKSVSHEACIKSIILPILIKSCRIWTKIEMENNMPKEIDAILYSCSEDTIKYINFVLSNLQLGLTDPQSVHKKMKNKIQKCLNDLKTEIIKQKSSTSENNLDNNYIINALNIRLKYISDLFNKEKK